MPQHNEMERASYICISSEQIVILLWQISVTAHLGCLWKVHLQLNWPLILLLHHSTGSNLTKTVDSSVFNIGSYIPITEKFWWGWIKGGTSFVNSDGDFFDWQRENICVGWVVWGLGREKQGVIKRMRRRGGQGTLNGGRGRWRDVNF